MRAYSCPGNIRELKNVIERAVILSSGEELLPEHLPREIVGSAEPGAFCSCDLWERWLNALPLGPVSLDDLSGRVEQHAIRWALETSRHNRARAAELLGFAKVDQLRYLMRKYGIE
jgi:DNA-binding NtrC family response regulator